ncbi:MBL fold metallo-hydrolase [Haladaptatus sp. F3-133]|uniref:MBL fold metallo-hydrolase n=1 Tax=Halorutilus salinus TaxID=2487751 RepID=A0A9Q4C4A5_9EURY|nr:MBL fold metallo-hydrolase [Halorutilus salinus]MCX2819013.1 MBL fold metallo-hydrolase [Halorutilus salinus]
MEADDVHRLDLSMEWKPGQVAVYLVEGTDGAVLIDAGVATDEGVDELRSEVEAVGYGFADIEAVLVTHPHLDHDGGVRALADGSDATVYAYETVQRSLRADDDPERIRSNVHEAGMRGDAVDEALERWLDSVRENREYLQPDSIDVLVSDGETFEAGGETFEAVHTPGHQRDHVCYVSEGFVFAGDAVAESFRPVIYHSGFDDGMWEAVEASHRTLDRLGSRAPEVDRVFPGHGAVFTDLADAVEGARTSLDALVEDVHAQVEALESPTVLDVTLARKKPGHEVGYVIFDNLGALGYLDAAGRVESRLDDGRRRFEVTEA